MQRLAKFHQPEGDHLTLLTVYNAWKASKFSYVFRDVLLLAGTEAECHCRNPWCHENFIQARSMRSAQDVRKQLLGIMDRYKHDIVSCGKNYSKSIRLMSPHFPLLTSRNRPCPTGRLFGIFPACRQKRVRFLLLASYLCGRC
jgi:HrpA-like RNA helicase